MIKKGVDQVLTEAIEKDSGGRWLSILLKVGVANKVWLHGIYAPCENDEEM